MDNYEQKYKEALERAKEMCVMPTDKATMEYIFPELMESYGEKIRKELIEHIKANYEADYVLFKKFSPDDVIAWLEKQSKETSWKPSKEEMDVLYGLAYITDQYDEHKEEVITRLYQDLKREFFNGSSYENMFPNTEDGVRRRSTIQVLEYARSLDTYNQYGKADIDKNIAWLEKQSKRLDADEVIEWLGKHIQVDEPKIEYNEDGQQLAESFIAHAKARCVAADEVVKKFEQDFGL